MGPSALRPRTPGAGPWLAPWLAAAVAVGAMGCQHELDMAQAYDASRAATTIRYLGVRGETRVYPDYGSIDASIFPDGVRVRGPLPDGDRPGSGREP